MSALARRQSDIDYSKPAPKTKPKPFLTVVESKPRPKAKPPTAPAPIPTIIDLARDPEFFRDWFKDEASWTAWFCFLRVLFGLPLEAGDLEIFQQCTGQALPNPCGYVEVTLICGRRSGKSLILALIAAYLACFRDYRPYLVKNEHATLVVIAADRKQSQSIFRYLKGFLSVPLLAGLIERETSDILWLTNGVSLEVQTASFKTIRGRTIAASLNDEQAFWNTDDGSANPDTEIFAALRPAMATIPGAMLFKASSPYAKRGSLYADFQRYYAVEDAPVLVWKAPTWVMNPSVPQSFIDAEFARDGASASSELGADFRADVTGWLDLATITSAVDTDVIVRPPIAASTYIGFCDPSGGVRDSFTLAVSHAEGSVAVLDCLVEVKAPFVPSEAVAQIAAIAKSYRLSSVTGDRYAAQFVVDVFAQHGITYIASTRDRSTVYLDALPMFGSGQVRLLDNARLVSQLAALERKSHPGGRDKVDHPKSQKDDVANAACGALVLAVAVDRGARFLFA
jgi:hypothetical protein